MIFYCGTYSFLTLNFEDAASALSFMLQNLGKPVIFTGSQIPLREPYNDARKNLIMATIFASSDTISEVAIFFREYT